MKKEIDENDTISQKRELRKKCNEMENRRIADGWRWKQVDRHTRVLVSPTAISLKK